MEKNNLPQGWEKVQLDNISEIVTGNTPSKKNIKFYGGDISYFKPTDLNQGFYVKDSNDKLSKLGLEHARAIPKKSTLVTCIGATIGKTGFIRTTGATNQQINSLIPNTSLIIPELLYYWCISPQFQESILENSSATTMPIINKNKFSKLIVFLPPRNEQKRIVNKIEELFSIIDSIEQFLIQTENHLKFYYQSILKSYFDSNYEILKLNDVCDLLSGKAFRKSEYSTEGVRLFQIANVSFGNIIWNDIAYLPFEYLKKYPELVLKEGDVIMALNRPIIRRHIKVGMLSSNDVPSILYQRVGKFILSNNIISKYLFYFLQSSLFIKQLESSLQGIDIPFINKSKLMSFLIPLPTLKEQKIIVQKIEEKFTLVQNTQNSIKLLLLQIPLIKNTILNQAFEGKLVSQDPNDEPAEILLQKIKQEK